MDIYHRYIIYRQSTPSLLHLPKFTKRNLIKQLPPKSARPVGKAGLVRVNRRSLPNQIDLGRLQHPRPLDQFPKHKQNRRHNLHGVILEEAGNSPRLETLVPIAWNHHGHEKDANIGTVRLQVAVVRKTAPVHALGFASVIEAQVRDAYYQEVN